MKIAKKFQRMGYIAVFPTYEKGVSHIKKYGKVELGFAKHLKEMSYSLASIPRDKKNRFGLKII